MNKLLITGAFDYSDEQLNQLRMLDYDITFVQDERLPLEFDVSEIDSVICNGLFLYNDIRKFKNLKLLQLTSSGMDRVPLEYIKEKGIKVFNAQGVYSIPMAEWVILKILEIYKDTKSFYKKQEKHIWIKKRELHELTDKTATIIGFGNVGNEIAKRLKPFGVKIISVDVKIFKNPILDESMLLCDLDKVLEKSDIVILSLPLNKYTKNLINKDKFKIMKKDSVLINVSRGGIIDELALIDVLKTNKLLGVALDVFENEPLDDSSLWDFDNVIVTPHNSFCSNKNNERLFKVMYNNIDFSKSLERNV